VSYRPLARFPKAEPWKPRPGTVSPQTGSLPARRVLRTGCRQSLQYAYAGDTCTGRARGASSINDPQRRRRDSRS
jgi:hypothetical protein